MKIKLKKTLDKLLKFLKSKNIVFITFLTSLVTISILYALQKIAPFGNNSMLDVDFFHQYGPLLNELYDRVKDGGGLLFSFNTGGGIPFYRNYLNYLSSPFNIILLLFKKENIVMAYSVIIGLKIVFASTTMSIFLKKVFDKNDISVTIFSLLYAFCGYFCAFYWNIMWLDGLVFLPIITLGITKIINEDSPFTYIISLAMMLFANYFIGYMICIFSVLFFIGFLIIKGDFKIKRILKKALMFIISSILAGGLVAFCLIPLYFSLKSISATSGSFPVSEFNFSVSSFLFNHISGVSKTVFSSDVIALPNIYCGLLTIVCVLLLFINKNIKLRTKIICALCILVFFFSFNVSFIDFIWHAFHVPNDLPWRYSFIYSFCLVAMGYYGFVKMKHLKKISISVCFIIVMFMIMIANKLNFKNLADETALVCLALVLVYYILYLLMAVIKVPKRIILPIMALFTMLEVVYSININWSIDHDIKTFMSDKEDYTKLIKYTVTNDNDLYRMEKTNYVTLNDGAWYNYRAMSTFSSMAYESVSDFQRKFGMAGNTINSYYYNGYQTPVYNTMFNIKYIMGDNINSDYYDLITSNESANLLRYKYPSSLAYASKENLKNLKLTPQMPFFNQKNFVNKLTGNYQDVYKKVDAIRVLNADLGESFNHNSNGLFNYTLSSDDAEITITLNNKLKKDIYLYVGGSNVSSFSVNDKYYSITSDEFYTIDIGKFDTDEVDVKINLSTTDPSDLLFYAYYIDDEVFNNFYDFITNNKLNVTSYNDTYIEGNINVSNGEFVFTTLAYDDGWKVFVDDKEVKTFKIANSYLGFDAEKGRHKIKLIYYPYKMKLGLIISFISLVLCGIYYMVIYKDKKNNKKDKINV